MAIKLPEEANSSAPLERNDLGQPTFTLTLDGKEVTAYQGQTLIDVAKENGIIIPSLCNDEKLTPTSACRMCLVEIAGADRPLPSCHITAEPGMKVTTGVTIPNDKLHTIRKNNLEMILSDHNAYCQPPCQVGCPTHIDIPGYLELIAKGDNKEAARLVKEVLPFPYILGLTCPHPCQAVCRRGLVEDEIAICRMHGFAAEAVMDDIGTPHPWPQEPPTGKRVAVVGGGPAGLTCAYYLALKGHYVKVFEMMPEPGGMLRYGIPEYRLPKDIMDREINHVWELGVEFQGNMALGTDFSVEDLKNQGFDAVFLGVGAWSGNDLPELGGKELPGVVKAIEYLRDKTLGDAVPVGPGNKVIVIGGGFTAFDCTRTSLRLGAEVTTVYRRSRKEMGATFEEVEDGENEGCELILQTGQKRVVEKDGKFAGVEFVKMKLGEPDAKGRRKPVPVPGSEFIIEADTLIPALGQSPKLDFMDKTNGVQATPKGTIKVNPHSFQSEENPMVFAGGDCVLGAATIIEGIGQGKLASRAIDAYLKGEDMVKVAQRLEAEERKPDLFDIVPYKPVEPQVKMPFLPYEKRNRSFELIELGYVQEQAQRESARCLQCACPAAGQCDLQKESINHGLVENRFHDGEAKDYHDYEVDVSHSFILRDPNKCINCTQCVRVCHDVIGPNCYGMFGHGYDTIVCTPFDVSLHDLDCVSCGACVQVCPTGSLMMAERSLEVYNLDVSRCIFCGDCVEVCPHGALGETPNFELSVFNRFGHIMMDKDELASSETFAFTEKVPRSKELATSIAPLVRPLPPRKLRE